MMRKIKASQNSGLVKNFQNVYGNYLLHHLIYKLTTMTSNEILKASMLDILFDNRNKQYGAYTLRKQYASRLGIALSIALSTILLLLLLIKPGDSIATQHDDKPEVIVHTLRIPKIPQPPLPPPNKPAAPKPVAERSFAENIKMVDQLNPEKEMKPIVDIQGMAIGTNNVDGTIVPEIQVVTKPDGGADQSAGKNEKDDGRFVPLERSPEFPGGTQAWANFLNRYLQTPADLEPGEKKTVLINFLVDTDGSVTGFKVVQSGGTAFDNEVIRVLRKMPKWKPAMQNGHAVAVPFTQPVTFVGIEE